MQISTAKQAKVRRICRQWPVARLALFGSRARGTASLDSDYDLLVEFDRGFAPTLFDVGGLQVELTNALGAAVDLIPSQTKLPPGFAKDAQILFERD